MNPEFLDVEDVLEIHRQQIERFGGLDGIRDLGFGLGPCAANGRLWR